MPYYGGANKIGKLDPETGNVKEYDVPNENAVAIHSAYPAADGSVWLGEFGINKLGKFDPKTEKLTEYADAYLPGKEGSVAGGSKHTVRIGPDGVAWASGSRISRFDPKTQNSPISASPPTGSWWTRTTTWFTEYNASRKNRQDCTEDTGSEDHAYTLWKHTRSHCSNCDRAGARKASLVHQRIGSGQPWELRSLGRNT